MNQNINQKLNHMENTINIMSQLSDMKEVDYRNTLALASIIEVLLEKKLITREDISKKATLLDQMAIDEYL